MLPPLDYRHAVLPRHAVLSRRIIGSPPRGFAVLLRGCAGRTAGASPRPTLLTVTPHCRVTPPCRIITPNYRFTAERVCRFYHFGAMTDRREGLPFYRGGVWVKRRERTRLCRRDPRPTLLTGLSFGAMTDRRRRCRCSAGRRGQFVLPRKNCVCFGFVRPAHFFANCPLCYTAMPLFTAACGRSLCSPN